MAAAAGDSLLRSCSAAASSTSGRVSCQRAPRPQQQVAAQLLRARAAAFSQGRCVAAVVAAPAAARHRLLSGRGSRLRVSAEMFDTLSNSLQKAWAKLKSENSLTADNIKEPMKDIRRALLEADVSLPVVRRFVKRVEEKAVGVQVTRGMTPDQQLVKVVADELVELMGGIRGAEDPLTFAPEGRPTVILMSGLQGVGKTTACGKLALYLRNRGRTPLLVAADVYRPAAIDQLQKLGAQVDVPVFTLGADAKPAAIAAAGVAEAASRGCDVVIVDTAGRLQIDEDMMGELRDVKAAVSPTETLLVVDAMTGQEAAALTAAFNDAVDITGAVLTKMDGDSRGGAALSVREVSGKPIKFMGVGEKLAALEPFYPERMTSRILGMGDVVTLVEKAGAAVKAEEAAEIQRRLMEAQFDFNDFLKQAEMVTQMGPMGSLLKMMPGMANIGEKQLEQAERSFKVSKSLIQSMTPKERATPELLAKSVGRRRRIAKGAGRSDAEVVTLIEVFASMRARMQDMSRLMRIAGGSVNQMSAEEMSALVGGKKRVSPGKVRRYRQLELRRTASPEEVAAAAAGGGSSGAAAGAEAATAAAA